jgi:hypothetical protein
MKKELNKGVVAGVLVLVVLIVGVLAWKIVFAPQGADMKKFTPEEFKEAMKKHAQSEQDVRADQMRRLQAYQQSGKAPQGGQ